MSAYLGTIITQAVWLGSQSLQVTFESSHDDHYHQLYSGRRLVGVTGSPDQRTLTGHVVPTASPEPLQVVAVSVDERETDIGDRLPRRPYCRHRLRWLAEGLEADTERFGVLIPTEFEGDPEQLHLCVESHGDGEYSAEVPAVDQSGPWTYAVQPIDDAAGDDPPTEGNYGDEAEITVLARVFPPDLQLNQQDKSRFTAFAQDGTLTVEWAFGWRAA